MNFLEHLTKMSQLPGISGREDLVRDYIIGQINGHCECFVDNLGNLIAYKKGNKTPTNKLYISAHMDEVGFIITGFTSEGLLRFTSVGGIDPRVVFGKAVQVGDSLLSGVIGGKPVHLIEDKNLTTMPKLEDMYIDIGAKDKEEAEKYVSAGDFVVFVGPVVNLGSNTVIGKAFDDRAGCAMMIELIQSELEYDVVFGFTTQEEVGCVGGQVAAYTANSDIGIALETTTASDIAGVEEENHVCTQNMGPVVSFMDKSTLYDKKLYDIILNTAKTSNIAAQPKLGIYGGNEARVIQTARSGRAVAAISLPTRYIHSPVNSIDLRDVDAMRSLLKVLLPILAEVELGGK